MVDRKLLFHVSVLRCDHADERQDGAGDSLVVRVSAQVVQGPEDQYRGTYILAAYEDDQG